MSQAFYTAIGGISASQKKIDVIADNIANMNTTAFKESNVYFENVFSRTLSLGSGPTNTQGGTNPMQVGLGVQLASITRNFANGTTQSTGRVSDLYIGGTGFFTVDGGNSEIYLTRAGNFNLDPSGYLVTSGGDRVLGTDTLYSPTGSTTPALVPPKLSLRTYGNPNIGGASNFLNKDLADNEVNDLSYKDGDFDIEIRLSDGSTLPVNVNIPIATHNTLQLIMTEINTQLNASLDAYTTGAGAAAGAGAVSIQASEDSPGVGNGCIEFVVDTTVDIDNAGTGITVDAIQLVSRGSDFADQTKLAAALPVTSGTDIVYTSKILDYQAEVGPPDNVLSANDLTVFNISADGSIDATYANGDKITVETRDSATNGFKYLVYQLPSGAEIKQEDITINAGVIEPANLQLQLGSVINEKGLLSQGGNSFSVGPNAGDLTFSVGNDNGFGAVNNGGLESSNVDLPSQFAEMIVTQRAIEANSRSFDTVSQILQRIISIGR